jgi:cyclomaltodextrinase / maltogenic alpha-amylase / neopullulanase
MLKKGKYKHYKGKEYEVIGVAKHRGTFKELVVYRALYGKHELWVRSLKMFKEKIKINGKKIPRFSYVGKK